MHRSEACGRRLCLVLLEFILDKLHWHRMRHLINIPVSAFHVATWPSSMVMLVTPHLEYTTFLLKQSWSVPPPLCPTGITTSPDALRLPWVPRVRSTHCVRLFDPLPYMIFQKKLYSLFYVNMLQILFPIIIWIDFLVCVIILIFTF